MVERSNDLEGSLKHSTGISIVRVYHHLRLSKYHHGAGASIPWVNEAEIFIIAILGGEIRSFGFLGGKGHQKFWQMKRHFWGKVTWKSVTCKNFLDTVNNFLK